MTERDDARNETCVVCGTAGLPLRVVRDLIYGGSPRAHNVVCREYVYCGKHLPDRENVYSKDGLFLYSIPVLGAAHDRA